MESLNITIEDVAFFKDTGKTISIEHDDSLSNTTTSVSNNQTSQNNELKVENTETEKVAKQKMNESRVKKNRPSEAIINDISEERKTRDKRRVDYRKMAGMIGLACYTSTLKQNNIKEAIIDEYLIKDM